MTENEKRQMKSFEAKARQILSLYQVMKRENADLYAEIERKEEEIERLNSDLRQCQSDYANLKIAKMIEISDSELKNARQRISRLVREVNKCIGILSTEFENQ